MTPEEFSNLVSWSSILGFWIGIGAIIISLFIYKKTRRIEKHQRENAEGMYIEKTKENLQKISSCFDEIFNICDKRVKSQKDEQNIATEELNLYYRNNHGEMIKLLKRSEHNLELWASLEKKKRDQYNVVTQYFDWLIDKFFPLNISDESIRTKIWTSEYDEFLKKKYKIDDILNNELTSEA